MIDGFETGYSAVSWVLGKVNSGLWAHPGRDDTWERTAGSRVAGDYKLAHAFEPRSARSGELAYCIGAQAVRGELQRASDKSKGRLVWRPLT